MRKSNTRRICQWLWGVGCALCTACTLHPAPKESYDFAPLDSVISSWMDKGYYPGGAICVMKDDSVIFKKTTGHLQTVRRCMWLRLGSGWLLP